MSKIITLSEAASIAIHGIILIARSDKPLSVTEISEMTGTSKHHVAKVMQRLSKDGFISSLRGPSGGFSLNKPAEKISFLNIFEAIEGKLKIPVCPMNKKICPFEKCIFGNVMNKITEEFKQYLEKQLLSDYTSFSHNRSNIRYGNRRKIKKIS